MAAIFKKRSKWAKYLVVDNSHIHLYFQFHANLANGFETIVLNKNELTINTTTLIGLGGKTINKESFSIFSKFFILKA